jgi:hypothetical protein
MKTIATVGLCLVVAIASATCMLSSVCTVIGGLGAGGRLVSAIIAVVSLSVAVGSVTLVGKLNKDD